VKKKEDAQITEVLIIEVRPRGERVTSWVAVTGKNTLVVGGTRALGLPQRLKGESAWNLAKL